MIIINPEFCFATAFPAFCRGLWTMIEVVGIMLIVYYLFVRKREGKME